MSFQCRRSEMNNDDVSIRILLEWIVFISFAIAVPITMCIGIRTTYIVSMQDQMNSLFRSTKHLSNVFFHISFYCIEFCHYFFSIVYYFSSTMVSKSIYSTLNTSMGFVCLKWVKQTTHIGVPNVMGCAIMIDHTYYKVYSVSIFFMKWYLIVKCVSICMWIDILNIIYCKK